jgi:hypothetical protein
VEEEINLERTRYLHTELAGILHLLKSFDLESSLSVEDWDKD